MVEARQIRQPRHVAARWYVIHALPGSEALAQEHLCRQGFRPFLPRQKRSVRHARRRIEKLVPFFPGYMFVPLDLAADRWRSINGTIGVRSLIMRAERPVPCPPEFVEGLMAVSDAAGIVDISAALEEGRLVRVISGPLAEMVGTLDRLDSAGRARVLLGLMSGEVVVNLDARSLAAA